MPSSCHRSGKGLRHFCPLSGLLKAQQQSPQQVPVEGLRWGEDQGSPRAPELLQGHDGADKGGERESLCTHLQGKKHERPTAQRTALCWPKQMWASDRITTTQNNVLLEENTTQERRVGRNKLFFPNKSSSAKLHRLLVTEHGPGNHKEGKADSITGEYESNHHSWCSEDT